MSAAPMSTGAAMALKQFEAENGIKELSPDEMYRFDQAKDEEFREAQPWATDPHYFKHVKMSALALLKLLMHARKGGDMEVMGMLQGKFDGDTMIVMDVYALPVEGTETRVGAQEEAYTYMFEYVEEAQKVGRHEKVMGWYHSHPGYGCWLSGIDVTTQKINQQGQDPFLAVVVDPKRTCTSGKVEVGAFRVWPEGYTPPGGRDDGFQSIPESKIEDFGVHANAYYQLDIEYFKSPLDKRLLELMWNQYWVNTLSSSPLLMNAGFITGQLADLGTKLETAKQQLTSRGGGGASRAGMAFDGRKDEAKLAECVRSAAKTSIEVISGLATQKIKEAVFTGAGAAPRPAGGGAATPMATAP